MAFILLSNKKPPVPGWQPKTTLLKKITPLICLLNNVALALYLPSTWYKTKHSVSLLSTQKRTFHVLQPVSYPKKASMRTNPDKKSPSCMIAVCVFSLILVAGVGFELATFRLFNCHFWQEALQKSKSHRKATKQYERPITHPSD